MRKPPEIRPPNVLNMRETFLAAFKELAKPHPSVPLYGWSNWNRMVGGFRSREFSILCGGTGVGKTTFLANISTQLLKQNEKHFVMSVETGHTDYMKRVISVLAGYDVNTGDAVPTDELARIYEKHKEYLNRDTIEFSLYDDRLPVEQLIADIQYMAEIKGCKIAMIDNLNFFMEVTRAQDAVYEMDRVIHELIIFCKKVDVHIIMVMHQNKKSERVESEFDIKGSSTAVQEAHNIFLLNRPRPEDIESGKRDWFHRELIINKMRRRGQYSRRTLIYECKGTRYDEMGYE